MRKSRTTKLDLNGNFIYTYNSSTEAAECNGTVQSHIARCANNISSLLNGEEPYNNVKESLGYVYVKESDYLKYKDEIIWLITKDDVLVIDSRGAIANSFKTISSVSDCYSTKGSRFNVSKSLNNSEKICFGYRIATKEHYINMIKEDALYYSRVRKEGKKIPVRVTSLNDKIEPKECKSLTEAARFIGCSKEAVSYALEENNLIFKEYKVEKL